MPRIDPLSLLRCLSVLLGPNGGIKSKEEVIRLANLMTKFSKKLVSKCIYIQILKSTTPDLLSKFMAAGGWNLIHMWLTDGILAKNWALIQELLELLLLCPVDIERLKSNNCPKLIKGLSKEGSHQGVRTLASRLVEQWLKMVKGEAMPSVTTQAAGISPSINTVVSQNSVAQSLQSNASITPVTSQNIDSENAVTVQSSDFPVQSFPITQPIQDQQVKTSFLHKSQTQISTITLDKPQTVSSVSSPSVYKITIRDGKQVLTQVQTDAANINAVSVNNISTEFNGDVVDNVLPTEDKVEKTIEKCETVNQKISLNRTITENEKDASSEVNDDSIKSKDINEMNNVKLKDNCNEKDASSVSIKSTGNEENRDKKDDKKGSSEKKSSSSTSSSKSSSKHSSSSSKHSSSSHRSSSHRSSSKSSSSSSSKEKSSREKDKDKHHSSSSSKSSSSKSKTERDKEKEKLKKDQAEKDKATLEKLQSQALSTKMGKIPKKKAEDEKSGDSPSRKSSTDSKDSFKENKDKIDSKKVMSVSEKKNISISIENRKNSQDLSSRPKTVKTFNSKFRSTGLEEEIKPPPPRGTKKSVPVSDKKVLPPKLPIKRPSPLRETSTADKKVKLSLDSPTTPPNDEKKGGIKLIPAKPKLMLLQESDMFMDALTASTKSKEPRKRKRRTSITKDGPPDPKKSDNSNSDHNRDAGSPTTSPASSPPQSGNIKDVEDKSLLALKPTFKFYQDTLETDEEKDDKDKSKTDENSTKDSAHTDSEDNIKKEKRDSKDDDENIDEDGSRSSTPVNYEEIKGPNSPDDPAAAVSEALQKEHGTMENRPIGVLKSVLLLQKRKGVKKTLKWKTDLESIRYFELDETERVNVTKTFTDMKQMEKQNEREAFQMARKLSSEDVMEEKTIWKTLIPIDLPPPLIEPGKESREKDIQYAREKKILQALYFNRSMIPDSPAEPDEERHPLYIEPKVIPLDDLTGNKESEKDFTGIPWPEPKPQLPAPSTIMQNSYFQAFRPNQHQHQHPHQHHQQAMISAGVGQPPVAALAQQQMNSMPAVVPDMTSSLPVASGAGTGGGGGGGWRTGDGKIVVPDPAIAAPMSGMSSNYSQAMDSAGVGSMVPPGMMGPPMYNQDGYMMGHDEMGYNNFPGPPPGPGMYGPPGPGGPPYQGPRGPPMHGNRGRGGPPGPGWFRGAPPRGMPWRGGWRGNGKQPPVCRQFSKNGYCRVGDKCQYLHPGVNCPPF